MNKQIEARILTIREKISNIQIESLLEKFYEHGPIYAWRFGLGPVIGRYFMIISQINHKTGNLSKTSVEYFQIDGIKYITNVFGIQSEWYRNILANPRVTIQTSDGSEQMVAVPITQDDEIITIIEWLLQRNPKFIQRYLDQLNIQPSRKEIIKHKSELIFLRFDPTSEPTPKGLEVDLAWIWPILLIWTMITRPKRRK